jgi:hypothetical protein
MALGETPTLPGEIRGVFLYADAIVESMSIAIFLNQRRIDETIRKCLKEI